jgi:dipeptidyl aminopeptidase/acylaminoacyl peptidase
VYESEDRASFPVVRIGARRISIPQPSKYSDLKIQAVRWRSTDGTQIHGVVYETRATPPDAPLLVRVHGGPAGEVGALRSQAVRHRHLLKAGYRVFNPAFRGSLGFGDAFLRANIRCQGEADLEDVLSGIDHLARHGMGRVDRVGIFGGSYGGYMTLRALAVTDRFKAGVALFGFVHNRWMTLETGDFTYETEYVAPLKWPMPKSAQRSDVFPHLGSIDTLLLLLHGDSYPICSSSQSTVTYRALEARGVPTGVVFYPGEGHGFRRKPNIRDSARRTLAWFLEHLPPR